MPVCADIDRPGPVAVSSRPLWDEALKLHISAFLEDRLDRLLPFYQFPLPYFIEGRMVVVETGQKLVELASGYRHFIMKDGLSGVRGEVLSETDEGDHLLVSTRFTFDYFDGRSQNADSTRYIRKQGGRMIVEMVENKSFPHIGALAPE